MKSVFTSCLLALFIAGCSKPTETPESESSGTVISPNWPYDGTMSFYLNGTRRTIGVFAQSNGYIQGEVVIRGSGEGMENTLMLTFKPRVGTQATINRAMTGYWDLGLCIPFNRYLLSADTLNSIRISSCDSAMVGEFNLVFRHESDSNRTAIFVNGTVATRVDTLYPFKYCVEG